MDDGGLCDSCATVLPPPDAEGIIVCPSCGRVDRSVAEERSRLAHAQAEAEVARANDDIRAAVSIDLSDLDLDASSVASATTPRVGCIIPIVVLVVIGVIAAVIIGAASNQTTSISKIFDGGSDDLLPLAGTPSLVTTDAGGANDLVLVGQDSGASSRMLVRLRIGREGTAEAWRSEPLPKDAYNLNVVRAGELVYVGVGDEVRALSYATGEQAWEATLTDKVQNACPSCMVAVGERVLVRSQDAQLTMFGPESSEPSWSKRLTSAQGRAWVVDGRIHVVDDGTSASDPAPVTTLDPDTGKVVTSVIRTCPPANGGLFPMAMDAGNRVLGVTGTKDVVAAFGFGGTCVVRWEPVSGVVRWTRVVGDLSSFDQDDLSVQGRHLLIHDSSGLTRVDLTTGGAVRLAAVPDARPGPAPQVMGTTVLAATTSTRGSSRGGLAGWDIASGKLLWNTTLPGEAEMMDTDANRSSTTLFPGRTGVVVIPNGGGARLVTFAEDSLMTVRSLDLRTGNLGASDERSYERRYESGTVSITFEHADPSAVLVSPDNYLQRIPLEGSGEIVTYG